MSKDNSIVILLNKARGGKGTEYRVAHVQAAENITYEPQVENGFNRERVINLFSECEVITDEVEAWREAFRLETEKGYVEYGIVKHDFSRIYFPAGKIKWEYFPG